MNYYELFDLPVKAVADKTLVAKKYIQLQKQYHPDFFTNENEAEKENALEQSAAINKAYNIFTDKEKTIEYFLIQQGVITPDEKFALPPDFLMEMMELNEEIDENNEKASQKMTSFSKELEDEIADITGNAEQHINDEKLQRLKTYYYKKKYLKRILDRIND